MKEEKKLIEKIAQEIWDSLAWTGLYYDDRIYCAKEIMEIVRNYDNSR